MYRDFHLFDLADTTNTFLPLFCLESSRVMPLFRLLHKSGPHARHKKRRPRNWMGTCRRTDEDGLVLSLTGLCLLSLADNMKEVWVKDYEKNYMDQYLFRHIMGPFNLLPADLVEELTCLLSSRKELSRAALHLLLLRHLSLVSCPGLATSTLCTLIAARCQALSTLNLAGAQQLPSKVLSEMLCCLPKLRSLSLAGTLCDRSVIKILTHHCPLLRHLDVSCCHFLSPAALLPLGIGSSYSSSDKSQSSISSSFSGGSSSFSSALSPLPISSLLALDIGFGEEEGDPVAAAAYLLLSLPYLERVALVGLAPACSLIHRRDFSQTDRFSSREGVPRLEKVWREWRLRQGTDSQRKKETEAAGKDDDDADDDGEEEEGKGLWDEFESESEDDTCIDEGLNWERGEGSSGIAKKDHKGRVLSQAGDEKVTFRLRDVKVTTCASLGSLGQMFPDIHSIALDLNESEDIGLEGRQGFLLATGLQTWSGQLQSLSVNYPHLLMDLFPALHIIGSSLLSLTLEGVKTSPHTPLLEIIKACPRLSELIICAEPPTMQWGEEEEDEGHEEDLPCLSNLHILTLNFSYEHSQIKPVMSWMSLKMVLKCLLSGSPLLEKISLVSLPCHLNSVLQNIQRRANWNVHFNQPHHANSEPPLLPLRQVQHLNLARTDVTMITLNSIMQQCKRLKHVDVTSCWQINMVDLKSRELFGNVNVVWK
ncbi:hypothetical protein LDENG_00042300 [Lucifuga dentata]|nr:hypothetical protein LDENG_00042300 [Lucifuga dentata]